jgi:glycosyltransferase involved in cell wall biosynthesis
MRIMSTDRNHSGRTVALFSDAPYVGGAERYLSLLAVGLQDHGFRSVMIVNRGGRLDALKADMEENGIEVLDVSLDLTRTASGVGHAIGLFRSLKCSILHLNLPGPFDAQYGLVAPLARIAGIRNVVSTEHLPMVPSFAKARIIRGFSSRFIRKVITVSEDNARHLIEKHHVPAAKIRVVYNGVPDTGAAEPAHIKRELGLEGETFLIAIVGMLTERKGHMTLFGAMKRLPSRIHLVVAGEGPMDQEYRQAVSRLSIGDRVHFTGFRSDIPCLLRDVDALVVPSMVEATPYVILEAMAARVPVVASGIYGITEQVVAGETGLLVRPGDEGELASAVVQLADDAPRAKRMGEKARERYESRFTLERFVGGTVDVYRELMEG